MSDVLSLLKSVEAILADDHFVYTSGKHGSMYINKDALYPYSKTTSEVCKLLAEKCRDLDMDTVVAPMLGGIILSQWVSYHLTEMKQKNIFGVYAEKDAEKGFVFNRGYDTFVTGKKVLVLEDLVNTGGSVKKVVDVVRDYGGEVVGVCVLANRRPDAVTSETFGAPLISGADIPAEAWEADECHLCQENVPINTKIAHGKKFLEHVQSKA